MRMEGELKSNTFYIHLSRASFPICFALSIFNKTHFFPSWKWFGLKMSLILIPINLSFSCMEKSNYPFFITYEVHVTVYQNIKN